jgi:hypothetical protein
MFRCRSAKLYCRRLGASACLAFFLAMLQTACGDTTTGNFVCDAETCIDCADSCCYDLGYC